MKNPRANTKELAYHLNPRRNTIAWVVFYLIIAALVLVGFFLFSNRLRTYSIPTGTVSLSIPYKTYLVGEPITFTVNNGYNTTIYIKNDCPDEPLNVYRYQSEKWVRIHDKTSEKSCTSKDRQVAVPAFASQSGNYKNWPNLFKKAGKYRVVAYIKYFNVIAYQDFEVIDKPKISSSTATSSSGQSGGASSSANTSSQQQTQSSTGGGSTTSKSSKTFSFSQGSISIQYDNSLIYIISVNPASGCDYEKNGSTGKSLEVTFKCAGGETQIKLFNSGGSVSYSVEND
jgi:hypothetical protein